MSSDGVARQNVLVGVSTALTAISVIIVSLRVYTRTAILHNIGKDDYVMVLAVIFTLGYLACIFLLRENGAGFSGRFLTHEEMTNIVKLTYAIEMIYYVAVNAIKISIVCFYLRIAVQKTFEKLCLATLYFLITFCTICIIVIATQCIPIHKFWDFAGAVQGTCINTNVFVFVTSSTNILLDIWILALPTPTLLTIQRPRREKSALIAIFALGAFSCIASIIRIYSVKLFTSSPDPFTQGVPINTWSMIEINVGIWCASIPALKALFVKARRRRGTGGMGGYEYHGSGRSGGVGSKGVGGKGGEFGMGGVGGRGEESQERIVGV